MKKYSIEKLQAALDIQRKGECQRKKDCKSCIFSEDGRHKCSLVFFITSLLEGEITRQKNKLDAMHNGLDSQGGKSNHKDEFEELSCKEEDDCSVFMNCTFNKTEITGLNFDEVIKLILKFNKKEMNNGICRCKKNR